MAESQYHIYIYNKKNNAIWSKVNSLYDFNLQLLARASHSPTSHTETSICPEPQLFRWSDVHHPRRAIDSGKHRVSPRRQLDKPNDLVKPANELTRNSKNATHLNPTRRHSSTDLRPRCHWRELATPHDVRGQRCHQLRQQRDVQPRIVGQQLRRRQLYYPRLTVYLLCVGNCRPRWHMLVRWDLCLRGCWLRSVCTDHVNNRDLGTRLNW